MGILSQSELSSAKEFIGILLGGMTKILFRVFSSVISELILLFLLILVYSFKRQLLAYGKKIRKIVADYLDKKRYNEIIKKKQEDKSNEVLAINAYNEAVNSLDFEKKVLAIMQLQNIKVQEAYERLFKLLCSEKDTAIKNILVRAICEKRKVYKYISDNEE